MGSGKQPTKTATTGRAQSNTVSFQNLPGGAGVEREIALVIPLRDINEGVWIQLAVGTPVTLQPIAKTEIRVTCNAGFLGFVPPQYIETVLERALMVGRVEVKGSEASQLRVRLDPQS